nr:type II secretion system protein GspH [Pyxidicoccus fallax]
MTLLELMSAIAITGVLLALAMPNLMGAIQNQRMSGAQRSIHLETLEARQQARRTRQPVRLSIINAPNENGVLGPALRWEQLDCVPGNTWGTQCPIPACRNTACSTPASPTGCTCSKTGTPVPLPPNLDVNSLAGLCWLGGETGGVVAPLGTTTCDPANPVAGNTAFRVRRGDGQGNYKVDQVFILNALTGSLQPVDCTKVPRPTECPAS